MLKFFKFSLSLFMIMFLFVANHQVYASQFDSKIDSHKNLMSPQSQIKTSSKKTSESNDAVFKFSSHEQQKQYETALLNYEIWRLDFMKCIHEEQKEETVLYSKIIFWSLIVVSFILIIFLIRSECFINKHARKAEIAGFGFKIQLIINSMLLLLVAWLSFLYYMYITQMYPII